MDDLRPFIFGAAWKMLDFLVELSFEMNGVPPDRGRQYTIKKKADTAVNDLVDAVAPFDSHASLWSRLLHVYSSTTELRHSLVHRRFKVDPDTSEVTGEPESGESALQPLTAAEQTAFCRAAQGVAQAVIDRTLSTRRANQLGWTLDQLTAHHRQPLLGAEAVHGVIPTVLVSAGGSQEITVVPSEILARAQQAVGGVSYFDLMLCLPDGRILAGALEDAPRQPVTFRVDGPPNWLNWK